MVTMDAPSAQHTWVGREMPKSGKHDPDCKWLCKHVPTAPDFSLCRRTDHASCRTCGSK